MNDQDEHTNEEADERKASDQIRKRKIIIIILSVLIGILVLGILGYVVFKQIQPSDSIQGTKEKIETTTSKEELKKLYDELIRSSVAAGASEAEILALLEQAATETGDQSYLAQKDSYTIKNPSFSLAPGTYQGAQSLGINKGNSADAVFYTTDGSRPTTGSTEYTTPISLPEGTTTVKAVEVNTKGLISPVLEGQYIIAPANTTETQSNLTSQEFIDKVYGVWYAQEPEHNVVVTISDSEFTFTRYYIDGVINGPYTVSAQRITAEPSAPRAMLKAITWAISWCKLTSAFSATIKSTSTATPTATTGENTMLLSISAAASTACRLIPAAVVILSY